MQVFAGLIPAGHHSGHHWRGFAAVGRVDSARRSRAHQHLLQGVGACEVVFVDLLPAAVLVVTRQDDKQPTYTHLIHVRGPGRRRQEVPQLQREQDVHEPGL